MRNRNIAPTELGNPIRNNDRALYYAHNGTNVYRVGELPSEQKGADMSLKSGFSVIALILLGLALLVSVFMFTIVPYVLGSEHRDW